MAPVPLVSSKDVIRAFGKIGYEVFHQRGSHVILRRTTPPHGHLSVPAGREVARGTLWGLIRTAGISVDEFVELLKK